MVLRLEETFRYNHAIRFRLHRSAFPSVSLQSFRPELKPGRCECFSRRVGHKCLVPEAPARFRTPRQQAAESGKQIAARAGAVPVLGYLGPGAAQERA